MSADEAKLPRITKYNFCAKLTCFFGIGGVSKETIAVTIATQGANIREK